jgi:hypothetical protein
LLKIFFFPFSQDEVLAVSEKAVLRVSDLVDWIADPAEVRWDRGALGVYEGDCGVDASETGSPAQYDRGLNARFSPGHSDFMADVRQEKEAIGERREISELAVYGAGGDRGRGGGEQQR